MRSAGVRNLAAVDTRPEAECITLVAKLETDAGKQYSTRGYINIFASGNVRVIIFILKKSTSTIMYSITNQKTPFTLKQISPHTPAWHII